MGLGDYFFVFKFGYDLKVVKKYSKPKSAPREIDRKVTLVTAMLLVLTSWSSMHSHFCCTYREQTGEKLERKYSWVSKGGEGKVQMTPKAKNAEPTTVTNFAGFRFSIDWKGSYFDLYDKVSIYLGSCRGFVLPKLFCTLVLSSAKSVWLHLVALPSRNVERKQISSKQVQLCMRLH